MTALARYARFMRIRWMARGDWRQGDGEVASRVFGSYDQYLKLQKSKLAYLDLNAHERKFRSTLAARMREGGLVTPRARILCLGARLGAEVAAFRDLGAFAVGVDLNPGFENPWVLYGDFHRLEFPDGCVDLVYSNSLDHCFDLARVLAEVQRVLVRDGLFVVEADPGEREQNGIEPDLWASFKWPTIDSLVCRIEDCGFSLRSRSHFQYPRGGTCLVFERRTSDSTK
jgi:SAM-dependent methyltransferase